MVLASSELSRHPLQEFLNENDVADIRVLLQGIPEKDPVVLAGDFNRDLRKLINTLPGFTCIDFICARGMHITYEGAVCPRASDHKAVVCNVTLVQQPQRTKSPLPPLMAS